MANKKISEFPSVATLSDNDIFLINSLGTTSSVTYNTITTNVSAIVKSASAEIINTINTTVDTLTTVNANEDNTKPINEAGFIKQLAKMRPSNYNCAAITTTNRVIAWGYANGGETGIGGKLPVTFAQYSRLSPSSYVRVPFYKEWETTSGPTGIDYLDENPSFKIIDLYWNSYGAMALLDNGTCWVAGNNNGFLGVGAAPGANNLKPTCGFVQVNTGGAFIKRIECASDRDSHTTIFIALDNNDSLWIWGNTKDGCFGTADATLNESIASPRQLTSMTIVDFSGPTTKTTSTVTFTNNIKDFSINAIDNASTSISIIDKNNNLYISGDNSEGQRGTGYTTATGLFNHARKNSTTFVTDAESVEMGQYLGKFNHFYINTSGRIFAAGKNDIYALGNNTNTDSKYFIESTLPSNISAEKIYTAGYYKPAIYALCRNTSTNTKTVYSWGFNGNTGYCGVDSTAAEIKIPTQIKFRTTGNNKVALNNVKDFFISDIIGDSSQSFACVAVIDNDGYTYLCGHNTFNDPPTYSANNTQFFIRVPLKNIKNIMLGGNGGSHQYTIFLLNNGTVWGNGNTVFGNPAFASSLLGSGVDDVRHPIRLL